jgi:cytochrome c5
VSGQLLLASALAVAVSIAPPSAVAQGGERSGKEVVESTCKTCHAKGVQGAPKIGDKQAWSKRVARGLSNLTQSALKGIRAMPAHGGDASLTDLEIGRAVVYMVNRSGGRWAEPASLQALAAERSGPQVVREQCAKCHREGKGGAPKIGDRAAWTPRLAAGLDNLVRAAIRGHGGMPARGERADLTDAEVRNAVLHMINPAPAGTNKAAPARAALPATLYKSVDGLDVHLGFVPAETMRVFPEGSVERTMHGGVPRGSGYYHVNVSLVDVATKARIGDAQVDIRVEQPGMSSVSKTLQPVAINNAPGYGNYVRMRGNSTYRITLQVKKAGAPQPVEAKFEHRTY